MEFNRDSYIQFLLNKKAEQDNTIDLNAYALGITDSKADKLLELLIKCERTLRVVYHLDTSEIEQLIKEATELK